MKLLKCFFIINLFFIITIFSYSTPMAKQGILDLRDFTLDNEKILELKGEWEFYWNKQYSPDDFKNNIKLHKEILFMNIPSDWTSYSFNGSKYPPYGYATYRLNILSNDIGRELKFMMKHQGLYHKLWINGKVISEFGIIGTSEKFAYKNININPNIFYIEKENTEIIMQISNEHFAHAGFWDVIKIGPPSKINASIQNHNILFAGFGGILLISSLYHFMLFIFRRKRPVTLFFALFSIAVGLRTLLATELSTILFINGLDFELRYKVEYWTIFSGTLFLLFYFKYFLGDLLKPFVVKFTFFYCSLFFLLIGFTNIKFYDYFVIYFILYLILLLLYVTILLIIAYKKKVKNSLFLLIGISIMVFGIFLDFLTTRGFLHNIPPVSFFAFTVFTFFQALVIARDFSTAFTKVETLSTELLSLDKLKDEFLANTSHELKTPLNGIIGIADSLISGAVGSLSPLVEKNLSIIVSSGRRLEKLVNDILDFSKIKNSTLILHQEPVNIHNIAETIITTFKTLKNTNDLKIENDIPVTFPLVYGDKNRLEQILYNLIGNAVKFTSKGYVKISAINNDKEAVITVKDTGIGIPIEKQEIIFKSFEQVDGSISKEFGGTGLGLSITKQLIEMQSGKIWLESFPNKGSAFYFSLPLSHLQYEDFSISNKKEDNKISLDSSYSLSNNFIKEQNINKVSDYNKNNIHKILVVDDEPVNLQVLLNYLNVKGYHTTLAASGMEALTILKENNSFSLIILDVMLPKMSGYEVCQEIRKTYSLFELPILMLTAKSRPEEIVNGFYAGANDYLQKPFERDELFARINTLVYLKQSVNNAINKTKEYEQEKQQRIFTENLIKLVRKLASTLNIEALTDIFITHLLSIIDFEKYFILNINNDNYSILINQSEQNIDTKFLQEANTEAFDFIKNTDKKIINLENFKINKNFILDKIVAIPLLKRDFLQSFLFLVPLYDFNISASKEDEIYTLAAQTSFAFENAWFFEELKQKTDALSNSIEKLKSIENIVSIIYAEPNPIFAVKYILDAIIKEDSLPYNFGMYLEYDKENNNFNKKVFTPLEFDIKEDIEIEFFNILDKVVKTNKNILNYSTEYSCLYFDFFPLKYKSTIFGIIALAKNSISNEVFINSNTVMQIFIKNISIYMENLILNKSNMKNEKLNTMINLSKAIIHELRTPIASIKGFASMTINKILSNDIKDDSNIKYKINSYMNTIITETERIDKMAKELLEYAGINDTLLKIEPINLKMLIEECLSFFADDLEISTLKINIEIEESIKIDIDKQQILKLFKNIIKNSIEGADITKENRYIKFTAKDLYDSIILRVEDNGIGIPSAIIANIFEPLVSTKIQGTGLGLPIAKSIIEKHDGQINIFSEENIGTTIGIKFKKIKK